MARGPQAIEEPIEPVDRYEPTAAKPFDENVDGGRSGHDGSAKLSGEQMSRIGFYRSGKL